MDKYAKSSRKNKETKQKQKNKTKSIKRFYERGREMKKIYKMPGMSNVQTTARQKKWGQMGDMP